MISITDHSFGDRCEPLIPLITHVYGTWFELATS